MLGITSDLHIFFTLAGATLFFFGIQNWKLFLVLLPLCGGAAAVRAQFRAGRRISCCRPMAACATSMSSQTLLSVVTINAALIFYALALVNRAELDLEQQYERSEALIATVMPAPIAARLKSSEERIADRIETLSVLFADLVSFTAAAHDLPPEEIVGFLDSLVRAFDALAEQHGVEKIKTVGDSYMAAAGFDGRPRMARSRSAASRWRCLQRRRAPAAARDAQARPAHRHPLRTGDRRRDRRHALFLRRLGRRRERRGAHGIARAPRTHPGERGIPRPDGGRVRVRGARRDRRSRGSARRETYWLMGGRTG